MTFQEWCEIADMPKVFTWLREYRAIMAEKHLIAMAAQAADVIEETKNTLREIDLWIHKHVSSPY